MTVDETWKERFRTRLVHWTAPASGNRRRALAASNRSGVTQLYRCDLVDGELEQVTHRPIGTVSGAISADGRTVYFLDDGQGDEIGHWVGVDEVGSEPFDLTPTLPAYTSDDLHASADGRWLAFTGAAEDGQTVFLLDARDTSVAPRALYRNDGLCGVAGFDSEGDLLAVLTNERTGTGRLSLIVLDVATGERVGELWDGPESSISRPRFSPRPGDARLVASSDVSGVARPLVWDARTGAREEVPVSGHGDAYPFDWSPDGRQILVCRTADAVQELSIHELDTGRLRRLDHPPGVYGYFGDLGNWFDADGRIVAQWQDATHPATVVLLDPDSGHQIRELLAPTPVPPSQPLRSVTYTAEDGQRIQAWLAVPSGEGPFPQIIETHGGPESVAMEQFHPRAQAWVDRGFAYLTVNYRGSITFGREFKEAIWGQPGELELRDVLAGRKWLVDNGICRADEVFKVGWSYGGFLTLLALGRAPGLWAGGMAGIAVADWISEYEDENEVLRAYDRALFGGAPDEKMELYHAASPLTYAEQVDAPVLIIQGRNDSRCPARQVEIYERRMRELGKAIEVVWFDAGHAGGADVELAIDHQARVMDFAERVLSERSVATA